MNKTFNPDFETFTVDARAEALSAPCYVADQDVQVRSWDVRAAVVTLEGLTSAQARRHEERVAMAQIFGLLTGGGAAVLGAALALASWL